MNIVYIATCALIFCLCIVLNCFVCICVLLAYISMHHVYAVSTEARASDP